MTIQEIRIANNLLVERIDLETSIDALERLIEPQNTPTRIDIGILLDNSLSASFLQILPIKEHEGIFVSNTREYLTSLMKRYKERLEQVETTIAKFVGTDVSREDIDSIK
jgi:hypothetical protein